MLSVNVQYFSIVDQKATTVHAFKGKKEEEKATISFHMLGGLLFCGGGGICDEFNISKLL